MKEKSKSKSNIFKSYDVLPLKGQKRKLFFKHSNFSSMTNNDFKMFFILFENGPKKVTAHSLRFFGKQAD